MKLPTLCVHLRTAGPLHWFVLYFWGITLKCVSIFSVSEFSAHLGVGIIRGVLQVHPKDSALFRAASHSTVVTRSTFRIFRNDGAQISMRQ
jgi:hypothetical protein